MPGDENYHTERQGQGPTRESPAINMEAIRLEAEYDPTNIAAHYNTTFVTNSRSEYTINQEGVLQAPNKESMDGRKVNYIAGLPPNLYGAMRDAAFGGNGRTFMDEKGMAPEKGLLLILELEEKERPRSELIHTTAIADIRRT